MLYCALRDALPRHIDVLGQHPSLLLLNLLVGFAFAITFYYLSAGLLRASRTTSWFAVLAMLLLAAVAFYCPTSSGEYYRESDIPDAEFSQLVLLGLFLLQPLVAVLAFLAARYRFESGSVR